MAETKNEAIVIPTIEPKNLEKKGTDAILKVIVSYVANDMQSKFISEYGNKMKEMPFELEGVLCKKKWMGSVRYRLYDTSVQIVESKGL